MPLPSFPTTIFKASGKTSKSSPKAITFPITHQNILRRVESSDSLVAASDISEISRSSMESSFEKVLVGRGISTIKADWQTSKAETMSAPSPKGELFSPKHDAEKPSSCNSDDAKKNLSVFSKDDSVYPRIRLDPTNCFLTPVDDASEEAVTLSLRGGQLETDDADMIVIGSDSEVLEDDYAQGPQRSKLSQWFAAGSSRPKSEKPRSGFGLGRRLWKSSAPEQSACLFDQEKEVKSLPYQTSSFATLTPTKLDSVEAMERVNASLPGIKLQSAHRKN